MNLTFQSITNPVHVGKPLTLVAKTMPNVPCALSINTQAGMVVEVESPLRSTNDKGVATWTWKVPTSAAKQSLTLKVHCISPGKEASRFETVHVR